MRLIPLTKMPLFLSDFISELDQKLIGSACGKE
jgi:hypothetical protein